MFQKTEHRVVRIHESAFLLTDVNVWIFNIRDERTWTFPKSFESPASNNVLAVFKLRMNRFWTKFECRWVRNLILGAFTVRDCQG